MYVCICCAVTEDEVVRAVHAGARNLAEVSCRTRAGSSCATCHDHLEELIEAQCGSCPLVAMRAA